MADDTDDERDATFCFGMVIRRGKRLWRPPIIERAAILSARYGGCPWPARPTAADWDPIGRWVSFELFFSRVVLATGMCNVLVFKDKDVECSIGNAVRMKIANKLERHD